jgi:hypothetical protein
MPDDRPITHREFARYASFMASHASKWAADCLDGDNNSPMTRESLARFTERMNGWLELMRSPGSKCQKAPVHCLADGPLTKRGISTICMREKGHDGDHAWSTFEIGRGYVAIVPCANEVDCR